VRRWTEPDSVRPVGATCPDLDRIASHLRRLRDPEARRDALDLIERVREANAQLRYNAGHWERMARRIPG